MKALQQKFSRMPESKHGLVKKKKRDLQDENSEAKVPKKKKRVYCVRLDRYYVNKSEKQETILEEVEYVTSTKERESIFCDHRNDLQHKWPKV